MPCSDDGYYQEQANRKMADENVMLKSLLCSATDLLSSISGLTMPPDLEAWHEAHKKEDADRVSREQSALRAYKKFLEERKKQIEAELANLK